MSPVGASLAAVVLVWGSFLASPYLAMLRTADALAARDVPAIVERINIYAVRASLVKQLVASGLSGTELERFNPGQVGLGAGSVAAALGPAIAELVTADRAAELMVDGNGAPEESRASFAGLRRLATLVLSSRWRGFRNVYVALPPGEPAERQTRVQFRLSRLSWRIVSLDLPRVARDRLMRALAPGR